MFSINSNNKKGLLLAEETLKIILAVIGIGFLVFLLGSIYFSNVQDKKLEHAKNILKDSEESIEKTIKIVKEEEGNFNNGSSEFIIIHNPQGWSLFSFIPGEEKNIPRPCSNQKCICVCDSLLIKEDFLRGERQSKECGQGGECLIVSDLNKFEEIEIEREVNNISISKKDSGIFIEKVN